MTRKHCCHLDSDSVWDEAANQDLGVLYCEDSLMIERTSNRSIS